MPPFGKKEQKVVEAVESLFAEQADLDILRNVDHGFTRSYLAHRLTNGYTTGESAKYLSIFKEIGTGKVEHALADIACDKTLHPGSRAVAFHALIATGKPLPRRVAAAHGQPDFFPVITFPFRELLIDIALGHQPTDRVTMTLLEAQNREIPESAMSMFEILRHSLGLPASFVYNHAIASRQLPEVFDDAILRAISSDSDRTSLDLLETLNDAGAHGDALKSALEAARKEDHPAPAATASITPSNGLVFAVRLRFPGPDGCLFIANALIQKDSVEGMVEYFDRAQDEQELPMPEAPISPEQALGLVERFLDRANDPKQPEELRAALRFFLRIPRAEPMPDVKPAESVADADFEELWSADAYAGVVLDAGLLDAAEVPRPKQLPPPDGWRRKALRRLGRSDQVRRGVAELARQFSRWHAAAGERENAARMARVAIDVERELETHPFLALLLGNFLEELEEELPDEEEMEAIAGLFPIVEQQIRDGKPPEARRAFEEMKKNAAAEEAVTAIAVVLARCIDEDGTLRMKEYARRLARLPELDEALE